MSEVIILGIDPGYDRVGWAIGTATAPQLHICDCIQTDKTADRFTRYNQITTDLSQIIQKYKPTEAAVETLFFSKNTKTAMHVSEARGIIIGTLLRADITVYEYGPTTIKQVVTGTGRADKKAVAKMTQLQLGTHNGLIDDAIDAAACYLTHAILRDKQNLV